MTHPCRTPDCGRPGIHPTRHGDYHCAVCVDTTVNDLAKAGRNRSRSMARRAKQAATLVIKMLTAQTPNPQDGSWGEWAVQHMDECEGCGACMPREVSGE